MSDLVFFTLFGGLVAASFVFAVWIEARWLAEPPKEEEEIQLELELLARSAE